MIKKLQYRIFAPMLLLVGAVASQNAYAFPCQWGFVSGESTGNYACQDGTDKNDWSDLDGKTIFGMDDWVPITKIDQETPADTDVKVDVGFAVTVASNLNEGTWSFLASLYDTYTDALIVLKDGKETDDGVPPADVQWSAYLVTREDNGIEDVSPFTAIVGLWDMGTECIDADPACSDNNIPRQISHISLYARIGEDGEDPPSGVPEPSILALIGISLVGVGVFRRRR